MASLAQVVLGQILGVAAQHDIGTTACHVGGHGDGPAVSTTSSAAVPAVRATRVLPAST